MENEINTNNQEPSQPTAPEENPYEAYGWEFHKKPLFFALVLTILLYGFIFLFIHI